MRVCMCACVRACVTACVQAHAYVYRESRLASANATFEEDRHQWRVSRFLHLYHAMLAPVPCTLAPKLSIAHPHNQSFLDMPRAHCRSAHVCTRACGLCLLDEHLSCLLEDIETVAVAHNRRRDKPVEPCRGRTERRDHLAPNGMALVPTFRWARDGYQNSQDASATLQGRITPNRNMKIYNSSDRC